MKDVGASKVSHISSKPLQYKGVTTPDTSHWVEVTF